MAQSPQVLSYSTGGALGVAQLDPTGAPTYVTSVAGTVVASLPGQTTVTASLAGIPVVVGSVAATGAEAHGLSFSGRHITVGGRAWTIDSGPTAVGHDATVGVLVDLQGRLRTRVDTGYLVAVQSGQWFVTASMAGVVPVAQSGVWSVSIAASSLTAFQGGAPWSVIGSTAVTQAGSWAVLLTGADSGNVAGQVPFGVRSFGGGHLQRAEIVTGSLGVTQVTSPWITQAASSGQFVGFTVASQVGQATVTASLIGQPTVTASCIGQQFVTASCVGQQFVTASLIGVPTVIGSMAVSQAGDWDFAIGSFSQRAGIVTVAASITAPSSVQGGALNVRPFFSRSGKTTLINSAVFSGSAAGTVVSTTVTLNAEGYGGGSFVLYLMATKTNTPTDIVIRPQFGSDGVTTTSYHDMGQGFWADHRLSDDVILASSMFARTYVGPVYGNAMAFRFDGNAATGSGYFTVWAHVELVNAPLWMGT